MTIKVSWSSPQRSMLDTATEQKYKRLLKMFSVSSTIHTFGEQQRRIFYNISQLFCLIPGSLFPSWLPGSYAVLFSKPFPEVSILLLSSSYQSFTLF